MTLEQEVRKIWSVFNATRGEGIHLDREALSKASRETTELLKQRWIEALTSPSRFVRKHVDWMIKEGRYPK